MSETLLPPACEATPAAAPSAPLRLDGAALLAELTSAAGSGADLGTDSGAHRMARLDRVLRGCAPDWSMHRLAPELGLEAQPSRLVLKRRLDQLATLCPRVALVLLTAQVVEVWETSVEGEPSGQGELALVTDTRWSDHPEDCTLPLSWLVERLATVDHEVLVLGLQLRGAGVLVRRARRLLEAGLVPGERSQLLVVHHVSDRRCLVEELQGGFAGAAANHLGEVILEGLAEHCEERLGAWVSVSTGPHGGFVCPRPSMLAALEASAAPDREGETAGLGGGLHRKLRPGDILPGRIAILGALGEGGHGAVYLAEQRRIGRQVAVKLLRRGRHVSALQVRLFAREIKSIGLLSHPNVVQIFQADVTDDGELFYAMELIDGASLTTVLARRGPLPAPLARRVLDEILAGLEAAHRVGVFHLDVKPSNVMLRSLDGQEQVRELGAAVLLDFGIARLADGPSESSGGDHLQLGTPGYMAPEQREGRRCDARTDVYAAGVVLYEMLTGLRSAGSHSAITAAELKQVTDTALREILATALDLDADRRFATAKAFRAALAGDAPPPHAARPASPFFYLSAHDESDRWRLFGRDGEIERLLGRVLAERLVVVGGPSGVGKTSLLRAGVIPELRACGCLPLYLPCRRWPLDAARTVLDGGASELAEALRARCKSQRVVLVFDHVEALAPQQHEGAPALPRFLDELAGLLAATEDLDVAIMLSLREEFVGRLVPLRHAHGGPLAELAVGPLPQVAAERALREPLEERGLRLDADLMETLFADLGGAARGLAGLRSGHTALEGALGGAVYPPHLQMVASLLYESLDADEERLTLAHYRALGGLDGVLREHLDRTLDKTLSAEQAKLARDLFKELVTSEGTRATRSEKDLLAAVSHRGVGAQSLRETLTLLQHQRLVVSVRLAEDRVGWELVHDSLVPRIRAWMDRRELDQRRAAELLRLHLNRSLEGSPHLLTRRDVREIVRFPEVVTQIDGDGNEGNRDPQRRDAQHRDARRLSARRLLALSRRHYRLRYGSVALSGIALVCLLAALGWMRLREREARLRDWAESRLTLRLYEISKGQRVQGTAADFPQLELRLHRVGAPYTLAPGAPIPGERYRIRRLSGDGDLSPRFSVAASGGSYALVIHGRSRRGEQPCPPAVLWQVTLPGYVEVSRRGSPPQLTLTVPTCAEMRRHLHPIPGGTYYSGDKDSHGWYARRRYVLGTYSIDRFEVSNASFRRYVEATASLTGTRLPDVSYDYGKRLSLPDSPVQGVSWREARNYCLWMGKSLPTQAQHEKAARGGIWLDGDATKQRRNPLPRRRYPWGNDDPKRPADPRVAHWPRAYLKAHPERNGPSPVDSYPLPSAAYPPLRHLVGNVGEWLADGPRQPMGSRAADGTRNPHGPMDGSIRRRLVHYGYWSSRWSEGLWISWAEPLHADTPGAGAGIRCATPPRP